jgi:hypothetical protein
VSTLISVQHEDNSDSPEDQGEVFAVEYLNENRTYDELSVSLIELQVTNQNVKTMATLAKSVYSCKNILKRGKKRELFKQYFQKQ